MSVVEPPRSGRAVVTGTWPSISVTATDSLLAVEGMTWTKKMVSSVDARLRFALVVFLRLRVLS